MRIQDVESQTELEARAVGDQVEEQRGYFGQADGQAQEVESRRGAARQGEERPLRDRRVEIARRLETGGTAGGLV